MSLEVKPETGIIKRPVGRPTRFTEEKAKAICDLIRQGVSLKGAADINQISQATFNEWRHKYPEFAAQVMQANAESEQMLVNLALQGARKDGRIALMMLERRFQESWCKKETARVEHAHVHAVAPDLLEKLSGKRNELDKALVIDVEAEPEAKPN